MLFIAIAEECNWDRIVWRQEGQIHQTTARVIRKQEDYRSIEECYGMEKWKREQNSFILDLEGCIMHLALSIIFCHD